MTFDILQQAREVAHEEKISLPAALLVLAVEKLDNILKSKWW